MDAKLRADIESLRRTEARMQRIGLIVDPAALSPANRRASYALRRAGSADPGLAAPVRGRIGFSYPNAR
ncbi:MAG: hypothetical protein IT337_04960 [Thermomicrobiales bacterium]|nr:hypothetical protein [Thermomicrobiales bacterium]